MLLRVMELVSGVVVGFWYVGNDQMGKREDSRLKPKSEAARTFALEKYVYLTCRIT